MTKSWISFVVIRGGIKNCFFFTFSQKTEPPPLPLFWPPQFFLIRIFWLGPDPPPFRRKMVKKLPVFLYKTPIFWQIMPKNLIKPFWIGWDPPPPPLWSKIWVFSDKDFLDWPPPFWPKVKKTVFFMAPLIATKVLLIQLGENVD